MSLFYTAWSNQDHHSHPQAFLYDNDSRFWDGWHLDTCFHLVTASWSILILTSLGIIASAIYLPTEGDYELIVDEQIEPDDR